MLRQRIIYACLACLGLIVVVAGCSPAPAKDGQSKLAAWNVEYSPAAFRSRAAVGDLTAVQLLLEAGIDFNATDQRGGTALRYAVTGGHLEIVSALLEAGADVNVEDNDGYTPLRYAAYNNQPKIVEALLEKGADVNGGSGDGWTPEAVATGKGYLAVVRLLKDIQP